jgi:hypothetical protein
LRELAGSVVIVDGWAWRRRATAARVLGVRDGFQRGGAELAEHVE